MRGCSGTAHAQVSIFTDEQVSLTPETARRPAADALVAQTFAGAPETAQVPGIAAYLGVPIEIDGLRVGVLCVYDAQPFDWTRHDVDVLRELASTVAAELERGRARRGARDEHVRLDLGFAAANIGSFDWDLDTDALHFDARLIELFGYTPQTYVPHIESFNVRVHPDDRERVNGAIARAIERCGEYEADYRVVHPGGDDPLGRRPRPGALRRRRNAPPGCSAPPTTRPPSTAPPNASAARWRR